MLQEFKNKFNSLCGRQARTTGTKKNNAAKGLEPKPYEVMKPLENAIFWEGGGQQSPSVHLCMHQEHKHCYRYASTYERDTFRACRYFAPTSFITLLSVGHEWLGTSVQKNVYKTACNSIFLECSLPSL